MPFRVPSRMQNRGASMAVWVIVSENDAYQQELYEFRVVDRYHKHILPADQIHVPEDSQPAAYDPEAA